LVLLVATGILDRVLPELLVLVALSEFSLA